MSEELVLVSKEDLQTIIDWWRGANEAPGGCSPAESIKGMGDAVFSLHKQIEATDTTKPVPEGMTADLLRDIAAWLDTYDEVSLMWFDDLKDKELYSEEELKDVRKAVSGKEVQDDLRRWADEIER